MISHGSMPSSRSGTRSRWTSMPMPSPAISESDGREPGGAAVLQRLDEPRLDELDGDLDQLLARERVADLHRRPLVRVVLAELLAREHGRAADPVAPRRRAVEHDEVAGALRLRRLEPVGVEQADAHRVDEAVAGVRLVEDGRAADVRHADAVAVAGRCRRRRARSGGRASPNQSPSSSATGRAPIAMMSRRIPPTPVAAPWNGSTADGWLCDSTLNATASPSPRSSTPAFSPGPWRTRSPADGSRFSSGAECL